MFICLEGIDGAGKSTQSRLLLEHFKVLNVPAELVCDPGTTKLGKSIRQLILDCDDPISPAAQMLLFSSARAELSDYIKQQVSRGKVVICDRWILSTLVYQSSLNNVSKDLVLSIFDDTSVQPDLCVLLDIDPLAADNRKSHETRKDRYERVTMSEKVFMREEYLRYAKDTQCAKKIVVLDADAPQAIVHHNIATIATKLYSSMEAKCTQKA